MRKKQIFLYIGMFVAVVAAMLGIAFGVRQAIRAGNLAGIDWYNVNDKEFVISTEEELYEFATLSDYYDFAGQTIKLGADIVVNEGNAEDWHKKAPTKKWQPITEFAGTFDGAGHSISGLYGKSTTMSMGLFSETKEGCVIRNVKLLNSYFTNNTGSGLGSILGEGTGTIQKVYSDAIIYGRRESNGGIAGLITDKLVMEECWFDGTVTGEFRSNGGLIGWVDKKADVTIDNCLNSGTIKYTGTGGSKTAGLVGAVSEHAYRTDVSILKISNSMNTGEIDLGESTSYGGSGIGCIRNSGNVVLENTYATISMENAMAENTVGYCNGTLTGNIVPRFNKNLIGIGGYQWTDLDFDKYWAAVEDGTPVLKCFADKALDLEGVEKQVDVSWYNKEQTEFVLNDVADFWGFAMLSANTNFSGVTIKLNADITLNETDKSLWKESAPDYNWFPIYSFSGVFDGQGHTISGIYSYSNQKNLGLFEQVNADGAVGNFKLLNSYFRATYCVGAVVGVGGGNISNVYTDAVVENTGEHTGGIIGAINRNSTISNVWFDGEVYGGTSYTGGITSAAMASMCNLSHCLNTGTVYSGTKHSVGGLVGLVNNTLTLTDSLNAGKIDDSKSSNKNRTGSVVGRILDSTETTTIKAVITSTYTVAGTYETSIGQGYPAAGAPFTLTESALTGNKAYTNTILNFQKYWALNKTGTPVLQTFAESIPELPSGKRPIVADITWYDDDQTVFVINTVEELYGFAQLAGTRDFEDKTVKLGKNITINTGNASAWANSTPQNQWASINNFIGVFDGCGHTISGLYSNDGLWRVGLFGNVPKGAVIKNVKVTNSYFEAAYHVGSIAGWLPEATVSNVYSDAIIVARKGHAGGIIGSITSGVIDGAWFAGLVQTEKDYIGGICSIASAATDAPITKISNCLNTGTVKGNSNVGGLVGRVALDTKISYSLGAGVVEGSKNAGSVVGRTLNKANCDLSEGVYAVKEATTKSVGSGNPSGTVIAYEKALLSGENGYIRTILDFKKTWGIVANDTPVLKSFGGKAPANPNATRATKPDTTWYNAKKDTFILRDYADLYGLAVLSAGTTDFAGKTIKLGNNITGNSGTVADFAQNPPLNQWVPISRFAGTFDGQGKTIQGISGNHINENNIALFGIAKEGAVFKDFLLKGSYFEGWQPVASIVSQAPKATISGIYSDAVIGSSEMHGAGIAGTMDGTVIENCWFAGKVKSTRNYVGGITSFASGSSENIIRHCLNTGEVKGWDQVGGIVGRAAYNVTIEDTLSTGFTKASKSKDEAAGVWPMFGTMVGNALEGVKVTLKASHGSKESIQRSGYPLEAVGRGSYVGRSAIIPEYSLKSYSGYTTTDLDFNKYWVAKEGQMPQLRKFVNTSDALNVKEVVRFDISWYKENAKTYTLRDKADLYGFAHLVNTGTDFEGKVVRLGNDIIVNEVNDEQVKYRWAPIGSTADSNVYTKAFKGTFDGRDASGKRHYISGLRVDAGNGWLAGLFGATDGATIKHVELKNSYFAGLYYVASIVGYAKDTDIRTVYSEATIVTPVNDNSGNSGGIVGGVIGGEFDDVWFDGNITTQGQFVGGIAGVVFDGATIAFKNCLNTGAITSNRTAGNLYVGGLIGGAQGTFTMSQCVSAGDTPISAKNARVGSIIGNHDADALMSNVYADSSLYAKAVGDNGDKDAVLTVAPEAVPNLKGYNAYTCTKLDFGNYWSLVEKQAPQLTSFANGKLIALDDEYLFRPDITWVTEAVPDSHGNPAGSKENPYIIMDRGDLYGFAELVNKGETFAGKFVRLGMDITVNRGSSADWKAGEKPDYAWTPIGVVNEKHFMGTFDGTNPLTNVMHTISGIYMSEDKVGGLFVDTDGATLKNFILANSYFRADEGSAAVAGWNCGGIFDTIKVANDVIVENKHTTKGVRNHAAGIVGLINEAGTIVKNCWFDGAISGKQYIGGIVSYITSENVTIESCLVTGEITSTAKDTGGIVGNASKAVTIKDSLVACRKAISSSATTQVGAIAGAINAASKIENVYATKASYSKASDSVIEPLFWMLEDLSGWFGYKHSYLNFTDSWYAMSNSEPRLQAFTEASNTKVLDTDSLSNWYSQAAAGVGSSKENPYIISNELELYSFAKLVNTTDKFAGKYIKLDADIIFTDGSIWTPIGPMAMTADEKVDYTSGFQGTFDGDGHKLVGMKVSSSSRSVHGDKPSGGQRNGKDWYLGFIGVAYNATLKNLEILDSEVKGKYNSGTFVGVGENVILENLHTNGTVTMTAGQAGGLIGNLSGGQIKGCWNEGTVTVGTHGYAGGLSGMASIAKVTIVESRNTGNVIAGGGYTGGLLGNTTIETEVRVSMNTGNMNAGKDRVGGLVGNATQKLSIVSCLNTGTVTTSGNYAGGFVGHTANKTEFADSLTTGVVTGGAQSGLGLGQQNGGEAELVNLNKETVIVVKNGTTLNPMGRNWGLSIYDRSGTKLGAGTCMTIVDTNDDVKGLAGYTGTGLVFDRPETPDVQEGYWVARKDNVPGLKCFTSENQIVDLRGNIKAETTWSKVATPETISGQTVDTYRINRPEELVGLAQLVNGGTTFAGKKVYLDTNIILNEATRADAVNWAKGTVDTSMLFKWTPIGAVIESTNSGWQSKNAKSFQGTFDGQGHTVSGLYAVNSSANNTGAGKTPNSKWMIGLFGKTHNATINNVNVVNSYMAGDYYAAGIVGLSTGTTIQNCYTNAIIHVNAYGGGGINGSATDVTINNCWFDGSITESSVGGNYSWLGGIVGTAGGTSSITNCLNTGTINGTQRYIGGMVGNTGGTLTITKSLNVGVVTGTSDYGSMVGTVPANVTVNMVDSYAYLPSGTVIGSINANGVVKKNGTTLTSNKNNGVATATFTRLDPSGGWVGYNVATKYTALDFTNTWLATNGTPILKQFENLVPYYEADTNWTGEGTEASPYMITTPQQLYSFAKVVTAKDTNYMTAYFKLGNDIVLNEGVAADYVKYAPTYKWTPIGTYNTADNFAGTLDGGNHSISGIYINAPSTTATALFAETETGAVVKDLRIVNSYISGDQGVGAFGGWYTAGEFTGLYTDAILVAKRDHVGGIIALPAANTQIKNCWSAATITSTKNYVGGIASGFMAENIVTENCLFTGEIKAGKDQVGGIVGRVSIATIIRDCLVSPKSAITGTSNVGAVVGWFNNQPTFTDVYATSVAGTNLVGNKAGQSFTGCSFVSAGYTGAGAASTFSGLDFQDTWKTTTNGTPILVKFEDLLETE